MYLNDLAPRRDLAPRPPVTLPLAEAPRNSNTQEKFIGKRGIGHFGPQNLVHCNEDFVGPRIRSKEDKFLNIKWYLAFGK